MLRRGGRGGGIMASLFSISSYLPPRPLPVPLLPLNRNPNPILNLRCLPRRGHRFLTRADADKGDPKPPAAAEKKSFSVAVGELFLGLASLLVRSRGFDGAESAYLSGRRAPSVVAEEDEAEELAAVDEKEGVIWEQRAKDVEAERRRRAVTSPGFSFSAAGLLFPYHLGVAQLLLEKGYIRESTPLAGSSAGAIICAVVASGNTMQDALHVTKVLAEDCRRQGTAFRLGAVLRDILDNFLPDDVHIRCNGRIRVAITQLFWRPRGLLVDQFDSKEDVINAVFASSFIPGYLAPRPVTVFRNKLCIDGGLTLFMPPTSASETVQFVVMGLQFPRRLLQGQLEASRCHSTFDKSSIGNSWSLQKVEGVMKGSRKLLAMNGRGLVRFDADRVVYLVWLRF